MYEREAKAKQPSYETRKRDCTRSYLEWCQEVGTWRIAMSRVLDTRNRTDSSKDSFAASRPNRDRRINFASNDIVDDVKLISRVFRVFRRRRVARSGGDGKRRDRKRDYFSNRKCHFPVYTTSVPGFLSFGRFRGKRDRNFSAKSAKKFSTADTSILE